MLEILTLSAQGDVTDLPHFDSVKSRGTYVRYLLPASPATMVDTGGSTTTHTGSVPWTRMWPQKLGYMVTRFYLDEVFDKTHGVGQPLSVIVPSNTL